MHCRVSETWSRVGCFQKCVCVSSELLNCLSDSPCSVRLSSSQGIFAKTPLLHSLMWRCLEQSVLHVTSCISQAPFAVVHPLERGDIVQRSEEFYDLLNQYDRHRLKLQAPSTWASTAARAGRACCGPSPSFFARLRACL